MRADEVAALLTSVARESALFGDLVVIRHADVLLSPEQASAAATLVELLRSLPAVVALCIKPETKTPAQVEPALLWRGHVKPPRERAARAAVWEAHWSYALQLEGGDEAPDFGRLDGRHALGPLQVGRAVRAAYLLGQPTGAPASVELPAQVVVSREGLTYAARNQVDTDLGELAQPVNVERSLGDLILNEEIKQRIVDIIQAAKNQDRVLHEWGLGRSLRRGVGLCCLFDGEPGTGKTLAVEVIAAELGLQLMLINTSQLFDKYIGETEKNLERVFTQARPTTHLLLFDEADALFSKRTEVKGSNDRYSNMNVGVLLQLVEGYNGVTVLTTNLKNNMDKAFERRIMFKVHFPMPDVAQRVELWRLLLPPDIPTAEPLDYGALGEVELSGGEIKNAILHAAFLAARQGRMMDMNTLFEAAYRSAAESGRLIRNEDAWA
jgi:AAA+ superfamily predicted ATPase